MTDIGAAPRVAARQDTAWDTVLRVDAEVGQRLFGFALRMGLDQGPAADVVQEALLRLWRELDRDASLRSPEAWTFKVVRRLAIDEHRWHHRLVRLMGALGGASDPRPLELETTSRLSLWWHVDRLPPRQREAVYLRYHADLTFDDVADVMGVTAGAARGYVAKAVASLRLALTDRQEMG